MNYVHKKFHILSLNRLLVITIKLTLMYRFCITNLQKNKLNRSGILFKDLSTHRISELYCINWHDLHTKFH